MTKLSSHVWWITACLILAVTGIAISLVFLPPLPALFHGLLLPAAVTIARSDFRRYLISHRDLAWVFILGCCFIVAQELAADRTASVQTIAFALAGSIGRALVIYLSFFAIDAAYRRLRGATGIASGDLILFAAAGLWLPLDAMPVFILLASGGALAAIFIRNRRRGRRLSANTYVPFGGFLAISLWLTALATYST